MEMSWGVLENARGSRLSLSCADVLGGPCRVLERSLGVVERSLGMAGVPPVVPWARWGASENVGHLLVLML